MSTQVRVAAVQLRSGADVAANCASALAGVVDALRDGATYVQLPEHTPYWGPSAGFAAAAQRLDGPFVRDVCALARDYHAVVHIGSLLEAAPQGRYYNTSVVVDWTGVRATYRKVHLFDVDVPGVRYHESATIAPGDQAGVVDCAAYTLGLSVCFDLRFPDLYRRLALAGATIMAVPAAFSATTGPAHWHVLLRARAIENMAFVVAAAQVGTTSEGLATYGHTMIVDPWGEVLAESTTDASHVVATAIDLTQVATRRRQIDALGLRRGDVYERDVRHD